MNLKSFEILYLNNYKTVHIIFFYYKNIIFLREIQAKIQFNVNLLSFRQHFNVMVYLNILLYTYKDSVLVNRI